VRLWLTGKRSGSLRRRTVLLGAPVLGIMATLAGILRDEPFGWVILWVVVSGLAIAAYLVLEQRRPRP
jgi:hypothetical protein